MLKKSFLVRIVFVVVCVCSFIEIYQHNLMVKLNYEYQRLARKRLSLEKEYNDFLVELMKIKDAQKIIEWAQDVLHMSSLKICQIVECNQYAPVQFLGSTSSEVVGKHIGIYDASFSTTGGNGNACS